MTRAEGQPAPMPPWLKRVYAVPSRLYDHGLGWVFGHRFVRIEHVGRRSGRTYHAVVEVLHYDPVTGEAVVMAGYGPRADWVRNIETAGAARLDFGSGPRRAAYRVLGPDEAIATFADYERRHPLIRPGVRLTLTSLLGWRYDGSPQARLRLVGQLPMIAFRPS
jgi:deazaflavin-dependent oxidoreductase (nitroreductase family)